MKQYQETYDNQSPTEITDELAELREKETERARKRLDIKIMDQHLSIDQKLDGVDAYMEYISSGELGKQDLADISQMIVKYLLQNHQQRRVDAASRLVGAALQWRAEQEAMQAYPDDYLGG